MAFGWAKSRASQTAFAYATTAFSASALQSLFITYYLDLFYSVFELTDDWFFFGELVYLVWNSVNDPLFGWLIESSGSTWRRRILAIRMGGFGWCLAFLLVFFPWPSLVPSGLHFVLSICLYDTMLSYVQLAHAALLADLAISADERARCNMFASICSVVGSNSIFVTHLFWDKQDLATFRMLCVAIAGFAFCGFQYTASHLGLESKMAKLEDDEHKGKQTAHLNLSVWQFCKQLSAHRNFWLFSIHNILQVFNCHFNSNFLAIFLDYMSTATGEQGTAFAKSFLVGASVTMPHIIVVYLAPQIKHLGVRTIIMRLIFIKLALAGGAVIFGWPAKEQGYSGWIFLALYLVISRAFNEAICRHGNLVVADLVDEDVVLHGRQRSVSSAMFGATAFLSKPGQSFAPMLGWFIFAQYKFGALHSPRTQLTDVPFNVMLPLLVSVPVICGVLQLFAWSRFSLYGHYLAQVKQSRAELEDSGTENA